MAEQLATGGGSSAVAASAHAGCERYRRTDPLVIGMSRRAIAKKLGHPDSSAGIPETRWIRAMTFEQLVRHERFVSPLLTMAVGSLGLARPEGVRRSDGRVSVDTTASVLRRAHEDAVDDDVATMITSLAVPFVSMEGEASATPVKPDFAIVAPRRVAAATEEPEPPEDPILGSWLIMGDAKDYERVRARIDDHRMLKGFLQVALGAESAAEWSQLPDDMIVHDWGALAVPRNAFLQPEAVVEHLVDHRREVRTRVDERTKLLAELGTTPVPEHALQEFVDHLEARFDPASCATCAMFNLCRAEVRSSSVPGALLIELGVRPELRPSLADVTDGTADDADAPASVVAAVRATTTGIVEWTGQRRVDAAGLPGTINLVIAKSDAAALGVHGIGVSRVAADGSLSSWHFDVFDDPRLPSTRTSVMKIIGKEIAAATADCGEGSPIHLVMPDAATGDVLVSIADSLAGVETSRMRWQRDVDMNRPALTFDGEPASIPPALSETERLAVSFLLEEDRARAMVLRWPLIDLRATLARHAVPGGPTYDAGRLDYIVEWAEAKHPLSHRDVSDDIASRDQTPGARLSNRVSDAIHQASSSRGKKGRTKKPDMPRYRELVADELRYKSDVVDRALAILSRVDASRLRDAYRELESDAQSVWRRRLRLHASDLVRFGRTSWVWRNSQVEIREKDQKCADQLLALGNPQVALDFARAAGTREVASASVLSVEPLRVSVGSRRIGEGTRAVLLMVNGNPSIEEPGVDLTMYKGSLKFSQMSIGMLEADDATESDGALSWHCKVEPEVAVGDDLIVADADWFGNELKSGHQINVSRPPVDKNSAPTSDCHEDSYAEDPAGHQWCCRSHESAEAEWADELARRREAGEMNPQAWPPILDEDEFDTPAAGAPTDQTESVDQTQPPSDLTIDDIE